MLTLPLGKEDIYTHRLCSRCWVREYLISEKLSSHTALLTNLERAEQPCIEWFPTIHRTVSHHRHPKQEGGPLLGSGNWRKSDWRGGGNPGTTTGSVHSSPSCRMGSDHVERGQVAQKARDWWLQTSSEQLLVSMSSTKKGVGPGQQSCSRVVGAHWLKTVKTGSKETLLPLISVKKTSPKSERF